MHPRRLTGLTGYFFTGVSLAMRQPLGLTRRFLAATTPWATSRK
jgi:hypothetical protein